MLYSYKGMYPKNLPERIRLSNGDTRTSPFSEELIFSEGFIPVEDMPLCSSNEKVEWSNSNWIVLTKTNQDIKNEWDSIREQRNKKIEEVEWRYSRFYRHQRLGLPQIDSIENLDRYIQQLADITKQETPFNVTWPSLEE